MAILKNDRKTLSQQGVDDPRRGQAHSDDALVKQICSRDLGRAKETAAVPRKILGEAAI